MPEQKQQHKQPPIWIVMFWAIFLVLALAASGFALKFCSGGP